MEIKTMRVAHRALWLALFVLALCLTGPGCGKKKVATYDDEPEEKGTIFKKNKRTREHYDQWKKKSDEDDDEDDDEDEDEDEEKDDSDNTDDEAKDDKSAGTDKKSKNGLPEGKEYNNCDDGTVVSKADRNTAEGTLYLAFEAILQKDDAAAEAAFLPLVDTDYQRVSHVKRYWLPAARKNNWKGFLRLVAGPNDPSYVICRKQNEGKDLKFFVGKSPPVGSNPPYTLHKVDGKWKIKRFTPH